MTSSTLSGAFSKIVIFTSGKNLAFWKSKKHRAVTPTFQGPDQRDPETFIRSFCLDYKKWNDHCVQVSVAAKLAKKKSPMAEFSQLYSHFLNYYIADEVELQLIAFGTDATFDPARLTFGSVEKKSKKIKKYFSIFSAHSDYSKEFFAELLEIEGGNLRLNQIFYIDPFPEDYAFGQEPVLEVL